MTIRAARRLLLATAALAAAALAAFLMTPRVREADDPAARLAQRPADWLAAALVTDRALDLKVPARFELWRDSYAHASRLAPLRPNARAAFVRSGLFHWYELGDADRRAVLTAVEPMLRDAETFSRLHRPLWELTRDFSLLRRANPGSVPALHQLSALAVHSGRFDEYRALRGEILQKRIAEVADAPDPLALVPAEPRASDHALLATILEELVRRPLDAASGNANVLIDYAIRHRLAPLGGSSALVHDENLAPPLRARLALALGDADRAAQIEVSSAVDRSEEWQPYHLERALFEAKRGDFRLAEAQLARAARAPMTPRLIDAAAEVAALRGDAAAEREYQSMLASRYAKPAWRGLCGEELCTSAETMLYIPRAGRTTLALETMHTDSIHPYVEIYLDDALLAEGRVEGRRSFEVEVPNGGLHEIEIRLVNPFTGSGDQRRLRLS